MVLVDTSVWIDFFRNYDSPYSEELDRLLDEGEVCITGLIAAEIVPGVQSKKEFQAMSNYFEAIERLCDYSGIWKDIIQYQWTLKQTGINGIGISDLLISAISIKYQTPVLTKDKHFFLMEKPLTLNLWKPLIP